MESREPGTSTRSVRAGIEDDRHYGAVVPPVHMTSTFSFEGLGRPRTHDYSRSGNPTRDLLASALRDLEHGAAATVTCTGMAAVTTVMQLVEPGSGPVLAPADCYGGTWRLLDALSRRGAFELEWVDFHDPADWRPRLERPASLVWLESPSNPLLRITDIRAVTAAAHRTGALVAVDNTFLSPALQTPIDLGADIVVHSTTKYINGHSDVVGGAVIAADPENGERIAWWANCLGVTAGAFDCWLALRGLRTLDVRIARQQANAAGIVELLDGHAAVRRVHYPGLPQHPGHGVAAHQQHGYGAIVSFELSGGRPAVERFVDGLQFMSLAESLGGVETLLAHPATMTHAAMTSEARVRAGITDGLLRLSVGLEDMRDLECDLVPALDRAGCGMTSEAAQAMG